MKIPEGWPTYVLLTIVVFVAAFIFNKFIRLILRKFIQKNTTALKNDPTQYKFLQNASSLIIYLIATLIVFHYIPALKSIGNALFVSAGVFAAFIGFAAQHALSNIISGVFIVIFKPFRIGDQVSIGDSISGYIEDITLRHCVINSFENRRIIIPNSVISAETIVNANITDEKTCFFLEIGISYDSSIDLAMKLIKEESEKHHDLIDPRTPAQKLEGIPPIIVRVTGFGDSSVNLRAYLWASQPDIGFAMKCDLNKAIKERFDKEGIEIPFPHRTIVYKDKLTKTAVSL
jgi:small conductance mechanosensitive channel